MLVADDLQNFPQDRRCKLDNVTCAYCGVSLENNATEDHVIGRNFIPKGTFSRSRPILVNACCDCNTSVKCRLEAPLSSLSMRSDARGEFAADK